MKILCDMDGVIADFLTMFVEDYNKVAHTSFKADEVSDFYLEKCGFDKTISKNIYGNYGFFRNLKPIHGAVEGIQKLMNIGHEVYICTAVPFNKGCFDGKIAWLSEHMPWFPLDNFIATKSKFMIDGDVIIDDGIHNLNIKEHTGYLSFYGTSNGRAFGRQLAILFDAPYNKTFETAMLLNVRRASNWNEVLNHIQSLDYNTPHRERWNNV